MARRKLSNADDSSIAQSSLLLPSAISKTAVPKQSNRSAAALNTSFVLRPTKLEIESRQSPQQSARKQIRLAPIQSVATQRTRFDLGPDVVVKEIPAPTRPVRTTASPSKYVLTSSPMSSGSEESESDASNFDFSENPDSSSSISDATEAKPDDLTRHIRRKLFTAHIQPRDTPSVKSGSQTQSIQDLRSNVSQINTDESSQLSSAGFQTLPPTLLPPTTTQQPESQPEQRPSTPPLAPSPLKSMLLSPSKTKLTSPSKQIKHIPAGPRTSLDGFWSVERVNKWNDQHSPQKVIRSPKKNRLLQYDDEPSSPTASPQKDLSPSKRELNAARKAFDARKVEIAKDFLRELDERIADGQIATLAEPTGGVQINWSKTLNSTAGRANWRKETTRIRKSDGTTVVEYKHFASIELAEKVIDDEVRLLNVLAHEFCHLANFMVLGIKDRPHGAEFKNWGRKCTSTFGDRGVEVTTKHTYDIDYKYIWACTGEDCDLEYKRHSKSIDPARHSCGSCKAKLVQVKPAPRKAGGGKVVGYAAFVKEHFATIKQGMPGASHKEVMAAVSEKYRAEKASLNQTLVQSEETTVVDQLTRELEEVALVE